MTDHTNLDLDEQAPDQDQSAFDADQEGYELDRSEQLPATTPRKTGPNALTLKSAWD
jgi:hypothetical protein